MQLLLRNRFGISCSGIHQPRCSPLPRQIWNAMSIAFDWYVRGLVFFRSTVLKKQLLDSNKWLESSRFLLENVVSLTEGFFPLSDIHFFRQMVVKHSNQPQRLLYYILIVSIHQTISSSEYTFDTWKRTNDHLLSYLRSERPLLKQCSIYVDEIRGADSADQKRRKLRTGNRVRGSYTLP